MRIDPNILGHGRQTTPGMGLAGSKRASSCTLGSPLVALLADGGLVGAIFVVRPTPPMGTGSEVSSAYYYPEAA